MANSETEIVNSALAKIGEESIADLGQNTSAARVANRQYPILRDDLLRRYRWNFAIERVTLAPEATQPAFGFTNKFMLPADNIRFLGIFDENELQQNYTASRIPHKIEGNFILADDDTLPVFYLKQVTNVALFDPLFSEALAWFLAIDFSYLLTTTRKVREDATTGFKEAILAAKRADAIEGSPEIIQSSEWVDSRFSGFDPFRIGPVVF